MKTTTKPISVVLGDPFNICGACNQVAPGRNYVITTAQNARLCLCDDCFEKLREEHAVAFNEAKS